MSQIQIATEVEADEPRRFYVRCSKHPGRGRMIDSTMSPPVCFIILNANCPDCGNISPENVVERQDMSEFKTFCPDCENQIHVNRCMITLQEDI